MPDQAEPEVSGKHAEGQQMLQSPPSTAVWSGGGGGLLRASARGHSAWLGRHPPGSQPGTLGVPCSKASALRMALSEQWGP